MSQPEWVRTATVAAFDTSVGATIVLLAAALALAALRRGPASARHLTCLCALAALAVLPVLVISLPDWRIAVTPPVSSAGAVAAEGSPSLALSSVATATAALSGSVVGALPGNPLTSPIASESQGAAEIPSPAPEVVWLALWALVAFGVLARTCGRLRTLDRFAAHCGEYPGGEARAVAAEAAAHLGVHREVRLLQAPADRLSAAPMTWGVRRPVVVLPPAAMLWTSEQMRSVLLHELAHVRRGDWAGYLLAQAVCAIYWFHPLAWWLSSRLRAESELACDDEVLLTGVPPAEYAHALLEIIRTLRGSPVRLTTAISMAQGPRLELRLRAILDTRRARRATSPSAVAVVLLLSAAIAVPAGAMRFRRSDPPVAAEIPVAIRTATIPARATAGGTGNTVPATPAPTTPASKVVNRRPAAGAAGTVPAGGTGPAMGRAPAQKPLTPNSKASLAAARLRTLRLQALIAEEEDKASALKAALAKDAESALLQRLEDRLADTEEQLIVQGNRLGNNHPDVQELLHLRETLEQHLKREADERNQVKAKLTEEQARHRERLLFLKLQLSETQDQLEAAQGSDPPRESGRRSLPNAQRSPSQPAGGREELLRSQLRIQQQRIQTLRARLLEARARKAPLADVKALETALAAARKQHLEHSNRLIRVIESRLRRERGQQ